MATRSSAILVVFVLVLASCGGQPTPSGGGSASAAPTEGGELVIASFGGAWGQAIQLGLIDSFERDTGIDVTLLPTQDVAASSAAVDAGQAPLEDMIDTNQSTLFPLDRDGYLAQIDYGAVDADILEQIPEYARLDYATGWGQFAIGLCYDAEVFPDTGPQPATWADFWDLEAFPGNRGMLAWPAEPQPEFGLIADGVAIDDLYPLDLDRSFEKLSEIAGEIPDFPDSPAVLGQQLVDKQVVMEACFTHRVQNLIDAGMARIGISYEQARLQTEYWGVWEDAPNKENAMRFIAYTLEAQPQAAWAQIGNTSPINPEAFELIPEDLQEKLATAPSHDTLWAKDDEWYSEQNDEGITNREVLIELWDEWVSSQG